MSKAPTTQFMTEKQFLTVLKHFGARSFSTLDFVDWIKLVLPGVYEKLESEYGAGGKGSGKFYSAISRVSQYLDYWATRDKLDKLDYRPAPKTHGNRIIRYWTLDREALGGTPYPDEVPEHEDYQEGSVVQVLINRYERDKGARQACIAHHGLVCAACDFDFEERYGDRGAGFIHVHHLKALSEIKKSYKVNPKKDLIPVCPNCHAMIHREQPMLSITALKEWIIPRRSSRSK